METVPVSAGALVGSWQQEKGVPSHREIPRGLWGWAKLLGSGSSHFAAAKSTHFFLKSFCLSCLSFPNPFLPAKTGGGGNISPVRSVERLHLPPAGFGSGQGVQVSGRDKAQPEFFLLYPPRACSGLQTPPRQPIHVPSSAPRTWDLPLFLPTFLLPLLLFG